MELICERRERRRKKCERERVSVGLNERKEEGDWEKNEGSWSS